MAHFVLGLRRTSVAFLALTLLAPLVAYGQFTGAWIDASSTIFNPGNDMCKAINNAYLSPTFTGTIDARGFTGNQPCVSRPFDGANKYVELLLNRNVYIIVGGIGVAWYTPQKAHIIDGGTAGDPTGSGATLVACGPGALTWSSGSCLSGAVSPFSANLTWNVHHGPWALGSYGCLLCDGGQGATEDRGQR